MRAWWLFCEEKGNLLVLGKETNHRKHMNITVTFSLSVREFVELITSKLDVATKQDVDKLFKIMTNVTADVGKITAALTSLQASVSGVAEDLQAQDDKIQDLNDKISNLVGQILPQEVADELAAAAESSTALSERLSAIDAARPVVTPT